MATRQLEVGCRRGICPGFQVYPHDNVQINGWRRISGIWEMRTRERKGRAESVSQGRWQAQEGRYPVLGRAGTLTSMRTSMRTPSPGA